MFLEGSMLSYIHYNPYFIYSISLLVSTHASEPSRPPLNWFLLLAWVVLSPAGVYSRHSNHVGVTNRLWFLVYPGLLSSFFIFMHAYSAINNGKKITC